jgi:hypothetical protein
VSQGFYCPNGRGDLQMTRIAYASSCWRAIPPVNLICSHAHNRLNTATAVQPSFIEPMQVSLLRERPASGKWPYEAKLDGYRCLAAKGDGRIVLWSPAAMDSLHAFPRSPGPARSCRRIRSLTVKSLRSTTRDAFRSTRCSNPAKGAFAAVRI